VRLFACCPLRSCTARREGGRQSRRNGNWPFSRSSKQSRATPQKNSARRRRRKLACVWCTRPLSVVQAYPSLSRDEKWVRNWFIRQRSKLATRNRKSLASTTAYSVPTFKLQLCYPPPDPTDTPWDSAPVDPAPYLPSPASLESCSPRPSPLTVNTQAIPRSHRSVSDPLNNPTMPTYSRDPLCNRYPDFSQFFRPHVHQTFELSARISNHSDLVQLLDSHTPTPFQGLFDLHLATHQSSSTNLQSCPVAFSMRLVDLSDHSSFTRPPVFPSPELGYPS
jgi:hypothetical protein